MCALSTIFLWFSKWKSLAISITLLGAPIGAFLWPPFVTWLLHMYGLKGTFIIIAGVHMHAFVFFALLRPPDKENTCSSGKLEKCEESQAEDIMSSMLQINVDPSVSEKAAAPTSTNQGIQLCSWCVVFNNMSLILFYFGIFCYYTGYIIAYGYTTSRGLLLQYSDTQSAMLSSIIGASSGLGRFLACVMANLFHGYSRMYACCVFTGLSGISSIASLLSTDYWYLAAYSALWGVCSG